MKLNFTITAPHPLEVCRRYFTDLSLYLKTHTKPGVTYTIIGTTFCMAVVEEKRTVTPEKHNPHNRSVSWSSTHEVITGDGTKPYAMVDTITAGQGKGTVERISLEPGSLSTLQKPETLITYDLDFVLGKLPNFVLLAIRKQLKETAMSSANLDLSAINLLATHSPLPDASHPTPPEE